VELLRRTYGPGFYLIGISSTHAERMRFFRESAVGDADAQRWIEADGDEQRDSGQLTSKTFHLADVFISSAECGQQLPRFLDLVISSPFVTPSRDERAMFLAFASSMNSGDLSCQVGAALASGEGDLIAVGYNEVPKAGGGRYEGRPTSARDMDRGWHGPLRGCAARPACAHAGLGARGPKPALRLAGAAPNSLPGGGPPCGVSQPFAPILPAGKAARPPRIAISAFRAKREV